MRNVDCPGDWLAHQVPLGSFIVQLCTIYFDSFDETIIEGKKQQQLCMQKADRKDKSASTTKGQNKLASVLSGQCFQHAHHAPNRTQHGTL